MNNLKLPLAEYLEVQVFLAIHSLWHLEHFRRETSRNNFSTKDLVAHFAGHQNHHGHSFASVFAKLYQHCEAKILSNDNLWYAGIFFQRKPTLEEATLYYLAQRKKFGLSPEKLSLIVAKSH